MQLQSNCFRPREPTWSFTNIRMKARLAQNHLEPGATLAISATLTEYGLPVSRRSKVVLDCVPSSSVGS